MYQMACIASYPTYLDPVTTKNSFNSLGQLQVSFSVFILVSWSVGLLTAYIESVAGK